MNLHRLHVFAAVVRCRSYTSAAAELVMSQPAVSMQVRALERELGVRLLERVNGRMQPTEAGEALYRAAVRMLNAADEAERAIAELRGGERGRLIVGANTTGGMYVVPALIRAFRERHPDVEIQLQIEHTERLCERILQNVIDLAFAGGPIDEPRFGVEHLCEDELVPILCADHPLARRSPLGLSDLAEAPLIVPEPSSRTRMLIERTLRERGLAPRIALELSGTEAVKKAVEAGLGLAVVSRFAVERELALGVLVAPRVEELCIRRHLELFYRRDKYFAPAASSFRRFAIAWARERLPGGATCAARPGAGGAPRASA